MAVFFRILSNLQVHPELNSNCWTLCTFLLKNLGITQERKNLVQHNASKISSLSNKSSQKDYSVVISGLVFIFLELNSNTTFNGYKQEAVLAISVFNFIFELGNNFFTVSDALSHTVILIWRLTVYKLWNQLLTDEFPFHLEPLLTDFPKKHSFFRSSWCVSTLLRFKVKNI